jgi:CRISPR system Cascade subunit CasB
MMAALRRGLGKTKGHVAMYPFVVPYLPDNAQEAWRYFTVAALFGYHHDPLEEGVSLGGAMARLERNDTLKKRFTWLLDATVDELPSRLKSVVSLLKSKKIGLDYNRLLSDLGYWDHPDGFVQLRWARDFYGLEKKENQTKE